MFVTDYGLRAANVDYLTASAAEQMGLPPGAQPGQYYARAVMPAQYDQVTEQVLRKGGASRIEVVRAQFQDVEERVLVLPASTRLEAVPPFFEPPRPRPASTAPPGWSGVYVPPLSGAS